MGCFCDYFPLIRKFFFALDAETAHGIGMRGTEFLDANELGAKMMDLFARGNAMFYAFGIKAEEAQQSADTAVAELLG